MEKGLQRLLGTAAAATVAGAMLSAPIAYADEDRQPTGVVQVCVEALTSGLKDTIRYTFEGTWPDSVFVPLGTCSAPISTTRNPDFVTVYQEGRQGAAARRITVTPPERLVEDETERNYVDVLPGPVSAPTVVTFFIVPAADPPIPPPPPVAMPQR